jgi:hypothetical protein
VSAAAETLWTARTSISSAMMLLQEFDEADERREEEEGVGFENESERGEREREGHVRWRSFVLLTENADKRIIWQPAPSILLCAVPVSTLKPNAGALPIFC